MRASGSRSKSSSAGSFNRARSGFGITRRQPRSLDCLADADGGHIGFGAVAQVAL